MSEENKVKVEESGIKYNRFMLVGEIQDVDMRETGAAMVWISASHREESPVKGTPVPTCFTPVIAIRIPAYVQKDLSKDLMVKGNTIVMEGRLQGVKRTIEGKDFYIVEAQASKVISALGD